MQQKRVLVVDVEATCWRGQHPPPGEQQEIIEIGLCVLDHESGTLGQATSLLLKPQRSKISPFCTQLTSITPEMAASGMLFNEACTLLRRDYDAQQCLWVSWGNFDQRLFAQQCEALGVTYPFSSQHLNLKKRFARLHNTSKNGKVRQVGFKHALEIMNLDFEGRVHRGRDDAWNTARLLQALLTQHGNQILEYSA